jgi:hypothetical protein
MSVTHANKTESAQEPQGVKTMGEAAPQFADNRASTTAQLAMQQLMHNSPRSTAQRTTANAMNALPVQQQKTIQRAESKEELQMKGIPQTAQLAGTDEEEPLQGKFETTQRAEDEELLQGEFETAQRAEDEELLQGKFEPAQRAEKTNNTGLPNQLKAGIENLSGMCMDHVRVHYNSDKPAQLQAHAYAQGSEIHVAAGQEQHLPHEAWHVVQQAEGRVKPTIQRKSGELINDNSALEKEADIMGAKANDSSRHNEPPNSSRGGLNGKTSMQFSRTNQVIQNFTHAAVGTMLHHAPSEVGLASIDVVNKNRYSRRDVLNSRRGELKNSSGTSHSWGFAELVQRIVAIRKKIGITPGRLPVVVNANAMISPGFETSPEAEVDRANEVYALSTVWGMDYKTPKGEPADYDTALSAWELADDVNESGRRKTVSLGGKAKSLLLSHAKDVVNESRNDVIPHRGLRNFILQHPDFQDALQSIEEMTDFVHVITLDNDMNLGDGSVLLEIADLAESHIAPEGEKGKGGLQIVATDYVYERDELFEWLAGALDKVGRKILENQHEVDAYPGEPGLTISYSSTIGDSARSFMSSEPFGPEYSGDPRQGGFKGLVNSTQSVEGKNIRERWRQTYGDPQAMIHRTTAHVNVSESGGQKKGHGPTITKMLDLYSNKKPIPVNLIQTLISADTYHSLTPDRNNDTKKEKQSMIVNAVTEIFNTLLVKMDYPEETDDLKNELKAELAMYMKS